MLGVGQQESETVSSVQTSARARVEAPSLHPIFPEAPGEALVAEFKAWVAKTGQPECFSGVSTSQPPTDGDLKILEDRIAVDRRQRPLRDQIPCAFCSPQTGKWLRGGFLIWCVATKAIYVIGPKCGSNGVFANKVQAAQNEYRRTIGAKRTAEQLERHLLAGAAKLSWIAEQETRAHQTDEVAAHLKRPPELARALKTAFKSDYLRGAGGGIFLQGGATCAERLCHERAALQALMERVVGAPGEWANSLAPSACVVRLHEAERILGNLQGVESRMRSAATFLGEAGVRSLALWSRSDRAPAMLKLEQVSTRVKLWWNNKPLELSINSIPTPAPIP